MLSAFPAPVHFPPFLCIQNRKITETETLLFFCSDVYARKQPTAIRAIAAKMMRTLCGSTNRLKINTPVMIRIMPVDITLQFLFLLEGLFLLLQLMEDRLLSSLRRVYCRYSYII